MKVMQETYQNDVRDAEAALARAKKLLSLPAVSDYEPSEESES